MHNNASGGEALNVLIVESNPTIASMIAYALTCADYSPFIVAARPGQIEWIGAFPALHPLVILDLSFVSFQVAVEFLEQVRMRWHAVSSVEPGLLLLTTNPRTYEALKNSYRVLHKPFHVHDLISAIHEEFPSPSSLSGKGRNTR